MWTWIKVFASPQNFYWQTKKIIPWVLYPFIVLSLIGVYWGLVVAPVDYNQGDGYRIIFVHVPSAWMSMFVYVALAIFAVISLVWRIKIATVMAKVSAPIGASFTFLALVTGSLWGKPMWGAWWVWDARLTSELILLFLYLAYISLSNAFDNHKTSLKASSILAIVGLINLPVIHYSVNWWNTLHQAASISSIDRISSPAIHIDMLLPLLIMTIAFLLLYIALLFIKARNEILIVEQNTRWVENVIMNKTV